MKWCAMSHKKFLFGVATSSYQIEGTNNKFESIWDNQNDKIIDQSDGRIACDFYHLYEKDIEYIENLGVDVYRMSLSWARIQPKRGEFSKEAITFYKHMLKTLLDKGIKVDVTLYHWDMPKWILSYFDGFSDHQIINYFLAYAKKAFESFDEYVNQWATINEPWCVSTVSYYYGVHAPFRNDMQKMAQAQYYTLLAHEKVYNYYKKKYHKSIGIVLNLWKQYPNSNDPKDLEATAYSDMFHNQVFLYPLFKGKYPIKWLKRLSELGVDLSFIDSKALEKLKDKTDYLGINYYQHQTVAYEKNHPFYFKHIKTNYPLTDMDWEINHLGLKDMIIEIREKYSIVPIVITENGAAFKDHIVDGKVDDQKRIKYIKDHLDIVMEMKDDWNIQGYYLWSLFDNFEWAFGYTKRFGIIHVDFKTLKRTPKESYYFFQNFIKSVSK